MNPFLARIALRVARKSTSPVVRTIAEHVDKHLELSTCPGCGLHTCECEAPRKVKVTVER